MTPQQQEFVSNCKLVQTEDTQPESGVFFILLGISPLQKGRMNSATTNWWYLVRSPNSFLNSILIFRYNLWFQHIAPHVVFLTDGWECTIQRRGVIQHRTLVSLVNVGLCPRDCSPLSYDKMNYWDFPGSPLVLPCKGALVGELRSSMLWSSPFPRKTNKEQNEFLNLSK